MHNLGRKEAEIVFICVMFAFSAYKLLDGVLLQLSHVPDIPVIWRSVGAVKQHHFGSIAFYTTMAGAAFAGPLPGAQVVLREMLRYHPNSVPWWEAELETLANAQPRLGQLHAFLCEQKAQMGEENSFPGAALQ